MILLVSGRMAIESTHGSSQAGPGDFILLPDYRHFVARHDKPIDAVILFNPLPREVLDRFGNNGVVHHTARSDAAAMVSRWIQDACADRVWQSVEASESIAQVVRSLVCEVMHERPVCARPRLDRQAIECHIAHRLQDSAISLSDLADTLHCSVRTLHRLFRCEGKESLERYIQRQRIEACAQRLRSESAEAARSLTELALQFGFSSSSHFANAFRAHFGISPSAYRKACGAR